MTKLPIGLQLFSLRDDMKKDFAGTLKKVKEMGYEVVEFAGLFDKTAAEVKALCAENGLVPLSAHVGTLIFRDDMPETVKTYAEIGCRYLAIPWADASVVLPGAERYDDFLAGIRAISAEAAKYGMTLCYHNHDFEFEKIDGKNKLDILYADTTPAELQTEIDTCWARVGGEDPAAYVRKYTGRAPLVHIKDYYGSKSANMYELIDGGVVNELPDAEKAPFELRPVGYGVQDVASILAAAEEAGAEAIIVEQDNPSLDKTPLECAKMSIDYIRSL